jgi:uncharacterized membrane protein
MEPKTNNPRIDEFRTEVADLNIKTPADSGERTYLLVGIVLMVVGVVLIIAGYWGASGTGVLAEQIPYVLSGGFLGLGVMVVGAALFVRYSLSRYLRYWLIRTIYEERTQSDKVVESLGNIEALLREGTRVRADVE